MNSYESLIEQLDHFIKKYYLSIILKGVLLFLAFIVSLYLIYSLSEFKFYFPTWVRWILLISFVLFALFSFIKLLLIPILQYLKLSKGLSHQQAAEIIGEHFSEVQDKLLNILQLKSNQSIAGSQELLEAGIQQKINQISWIPFKNAVDLKKNKRFLRYAIPPLLILIALILIAPKILSESNARLIQPYKTFEKPAPFNITIENKSLKVAQFADAEIPILVQGEILPDKLEWVQNGKSYPITKTDANHFVYKALQVENDIKFRIYANGFFTKEYTLKVLKKALVSNFSVSLKYPAYTQRKEEKLKNTGDFIVPEGTQISWFLSTQNVQKIQVQFKGEKPLSLTKKQDVFTFSKRILVNTSYKIYAFNADNPQGDSALYTITTIADQFPTIQVEQIIDSNQKAQLFFMGNASDDYGISKLVFHASIKNDKNQIKKTIETPIPFKQAAISDFTHTFNLNSLQLQAGEEVEYYFIVWDNDAIHGRKSTKSSVFVYQIPSVKSLKEHEVANNTNIKSDIQSAGKDIQQLAKEMESFKEKILTKKNLGWEDKKEAEDLIKKHEQLKDDLQDIKNKYEENIKSQDLYKKVNPDIQDKQEKINEMMDKLLSQEMQDILKELQELLQKYQQKDAFENIENMQMSNDRIQNELDKMLELFKKLEFEQKASDVAQELEDLSKKQEDLMKQPNAENQQKLNEQFQDISKDLEQLDKLNQQQNNKIDLEPSKQMQEDVQKSMNQAQQNLENNQTQPAENQQNKASQGMAKMAANIRGQMSKMQKEQHLEDINTIRRILSNLLIFSKDQESLMMRTRKISPFDVKYGNLVQEQQNLRVEYAIIEDSLVALSKRVFQLKPFITDELYKLKRDLNKSINLLEDRNPGPATASQQYAMTSANNLALMLSETMNQMQLAMQMPGQGSESGSEPKIPGPGDLKKLQEQLGQDIQKLGNQLKQGQSGTEMSKELAEMAQRQAVIREALRKMKEQMSQEQKNKSKIDQLIDDLDKNETDIVNKRITQQTLLRQKNIETRMLDFEKSMRDQGEKEERKSQTAQDIPGAIPPEIEEFLKKKGQNLNISRKLPPELKPFYKKLVDKYYNTK